MLLTRFDRVLIVAEMARGEMLEGNGERVKIGQLAEGIRWMLFPRR